MDTLLVNMDSSGQQIAFYFLKRVLLMKTFEVEKGKKNFLAIKLN